ncbi:histidinol-phosphatase HisJ [Halobacillus sp. Marseille-Q1614]|uniref:histidinol-phosphatase HisJ n=1 Tax=Halobacillus sp. Marseille-Q1614 TaxID=2709134 RepID=UPI0015703E23|nr:histidinol-phosphatase HisJ [Halobacillus sp. Marseille-Q1614]
MIDGHVHTPYCPHGSNAALEEYIDQAIKSGYSSITFAEHAPLPETFIDPVPEQDSSMERSLVEPYIKEVQSLKKSYSSDIEIKLGFEVDYIKGYEKETESFLNQYGSSLDDSLLSVHFLPVKKQWFCIDYSPDVFSAACRAIGSIDELYERYYKLLKDSAHVDLGPYKPNRIGHMTLIRKFHHIYPSPEGWKKQAASFLSVVKNNGLDLDYNGAGTLKEYCRESYPPPDLAKMAYEKGISLIYGSDAHDPNGIKQGYEILNQTLMKI